MKVLIPFLFILTACSNVQNQKEYDVLRAENEALKTAVDSLQKNNSKQEITFVQIVKFKSTIHDSEVIKTINERKLQFLEVPGLVQKYYMQEKATGEYSGIYLWASEKDFLNYRETELGKTIGSAYKVDGKPRMELFEMLFPLRKN